MEDIRKYWVGFNLVKGIGAVRLKALLDAFGDAKSAWEASPESLREVGLNAKLIDHLAKVRTSISLDDVWQNIQNQGITVLTWNDEGYPARLQEVSPSPPVLYVRGRLTMEDHWAVAIVGTRRITAYGRQVTEQIVSVLAHAGVTIVSGLARGIDGVAHKAALEAGGRTLAVLGSGVDKIYPPEHRKLAEQIMEHGALISDYPPGTPPEASNFPPRNRIISGLSMATVIVEADLKSGALITAEFAAEQGREVFAVPGNVLAPQSRGTNRLIQDGAHPLLDPHEILEVLDLTRISEHQTARMVLPSNATEAQLFGLLTHEPLHVDEIRAQVTLPIEQVISTLALMELKGMVRQVGGMRYTAVKEESAVYETDETGE
jgi:DNA processing protein